MVVLRITTLSLTPAKFDGGDSSSQEMPVAPDRRHFETSLVESHAAGRKKWPICFCNTWFSRSRNRRKLSDPETRFLDAGLDSMMIVEMSSQNAGRIRSENCSSDDARVSTIRGSAILATSS